MRPREHAIDDGEKVARLFQRRHIKKKKEIEKKKKQRPK